MPLKNFLYVLLLLSLPTMAQVKMMKIEGTVINQQTQLPLQGVTITVKNPLRQTTTDAKGNYSLPQAIFSFSSPCKAILRTKKYTL